MKNCSILIITAGVVFAFGAMLNADDWMHWRGLHRDDKVTESSGWKEGRWNLVERWKTNVGEGSTTPVLNDYLQLGVPERRVTFRTIWYEREQRARGLKSQFQRYENWPMRGLFWLSKDLFEDEPGFREAVEPDAQELNEIRNHAEHKYLKVHDTMWSPELAGSRASLGTGDRLAHSLSRPEFEAKTIRILKHARAALIYLSLGIHCEEQRRRSEKGDDFISVPSFLDTWDDELKV